MKAIFNLMLILLLSNLLMAQEVRYRTDFFSWNDNIKSTKDIRYIYGGDLLIIRHFAKNDNWEIIQINDSTFSYFQYDSTLIRTSTTGSLVTKKDVFRIDTVITYHQVTFKTLPEYYLITYPLIKHGFWKGKIDSLWLSGDYENNVKEGEWFIENFNDDGDFRKRIYENGKVISEKQRNLMKTLSRDSIEKRLIGDWYSSSGVYGSDNIQFIKNDCYNIYNNIYTFNQDTLKYKGVSSHGMYKKERRWLINENMELIIDNLKYRIVYFLEDEDWIELERIKE